MSKVLKSVLLILLLGAVVFAAIGAVVWNAYQPMSSTSQPTKRFVITAGQSTTSIANKLVSEGLIKMPLIFRLEVKRQGLDNKIQAGSFELSPSMTVSDIVAALTSGTNDVWITIPEGWRREELADSLAANEELAAFDKAEFLSLTATSEGRLFPETYLVPKQATAQSLVSLLRRTFTQRIETGLASELAASQRSFADIMIMASLLEREATTYEQMRLVSGILWNRIEIGMPLQVDATLQYAKGYNTETGNWWSVPTSVDRQRPSAFNTYANPGLPPGPIASAGENAYKAALNPLPTAYLFYIHDTQGQIHPAETLDQHNANIERYLR